MQPNQHRWRVGKLTANIIENLPCSEARSEFCNSKFLRFWIFSEFRHSEVPTFRNSDFQNSGILTLEISDQKCECPNHNLLASILDTVSDHNFNQLSKIELIHKSFNMIICTNAIFALNLHFCFPVSNQYIWP